jgi:hypothetical protein
MMNKQKRLNCHAPGTDVAFVRTENVVNLRAQPSETKEKQFECGCLYPANMLAECLFVVHALKAR